MAQAVRSAGSLLLAMLYVACSPVERPSLPAGVRINELVAIGSALIDEDGDPTDWVELHNSGTRSVSLAGWSLSDDPRRPLRWVFPDVDLPPGGLLLVHASGKDRRSPDGPLHTSFRLSHRGEYLGLFSSLPDPLEVSSLREGFPPQRAGYSFGRSADGHRLGFLSPATPGAANPGQVLQGSAGAVSLSPPGGRFRKPVQVSLSCQDPKAQLRFSLDGSDPTRGSGQPYQAPIEVSEPTLIRAAAFLPGALPSEVVTHSYLVESQPRHLPAVSLAVHPEDLRGRKGILGMSDPDRQTLYDGGWRKGEPGSYFNPLERGRAWERPASIEYLPPGATEFGLEFPAGIRVSGSEYTRSHIGQDARPSYRLVLRNDYGQAWVSYPLIPRSKRRTFRRLLLRRPLEAAHAQMVRDELARRLWADMGNTSPMGSFVRLYLNGRDQGPYLLLERLDAGFLRDTGDGWQDWDVVQPQGAMRDGDRKAWKELMSHAPARRCLGEDNAKAVAARIDLTSFVDYLLLESFAANSDWPHNNWVAVRPRRPGAVFRFCVWDTEYGFGYRHTDPRWDVFLEGLHRIDVTRDLARLFRALLADSAHNLVAYGASGRWVEGRVEPPSDWRSARFDDASWAEGPAHISQGDSGAASVYFRHQFHLDEPERLDQLLLSIRYDDAVVVYLNGHEVHRTAGLKRAGLYPPHDTLSRVDHKPGLARTAAELSEHLPLLRQGRNILAIQAHRHSLESRGPGFEVELTGYVHDYSTPFRRLFADRARLHLMADGALSEGNVRARLAEIARTCRPAMPDFDRWNRATPIQEGWLPQRGKTLLQLLRAHGLAEPDP